MRKRLWKRVVAVSLNLGLIAGSFAGTPGLLGRVEAAEQTVIENQSEVVLTEDMEKDFPDTLVPSQEEIQQWKEDGSYERRLSFMQSVNNNHSQKSGNEEGLVTASLLEGASNPAQQLDSFQKTMPSEGEVKTLVFMVQFTDCKNTNQSLTQQAVAQSFFKDGTKENYPYESLTNYYQRSSYGKLNLSGDVYGWFDLAHDRQYYKMADNGREQIIQELLTAYDDTIDFSQYDSDKDGYVDSIYLMYAGEAESWGDFYWAYKANVSGTIACDSVLLNSYVFMMAQESALTAIHETGHLLGLPDYYIYDASTMSDQSVSELGGVGYFDMMDHNYGDFNIFSKLLLGWVEPQYVTSDSNITLNAISDSSAKAVIVTPNKDENIFSEYYLLELYNNEGNNNNSVKCNEGGVRIYHIKADMALYDDGTGYFRYSNSDPVSEFKLIKLLEADGTEENGLLDMPITADKYYYTGMTFGVNTYPSSEFYEGVYTGIEMAFQNVNAKTAEVSVRFTEQDTQKPQYRSGLNRHGEYIGKVHNLNCYQMYFDSAVYPGGNFDKITCYKKGEPEKTLKLTAQILNARTENAVWDNVLYPDSLSGYNILKVMVSDELEAGAEYVIELPQGAVKDAYGNENDTVTQEIQALNPQQNLTVKNWNLKVLPAEVSDEYSLPTYNPMHDLQLSDGSYVFADAGYAEGDYYENPAILEKPALLAFKRFADGEKTADCAVALKKRWIDNQHVVDLYELENGNICIIFSEEYVVVDKNGCVQKEEVFEKFNANPYVQVFEREDCIDVYNDNVAEHAIYRISKADGSLSLIENDIETHMIPYYDASYSTYDYERWYLETYENPAEKFYRENVAVKAINNSTIPTYTRATEGDVYKSSCLEFCGAGDLKRYFSKYDNNNYKVADVQLCSAYGMPTDNSVVEIANDGGYLYVAAATKGGTYSSSRQYYGSYIIRLDKDYNVKWISFMKDISGDVNSAYYDNGKIVAVMASDVIELEDVDGMLRSSEKGFSFKDMNIFVDTENQALTVPADYTIADLKASVSGEYQEIVYYNKDMQHISGGTGCADGGMLAVKSADELCTWYYKIQLQQ